MPEAALMGLESHQPLPMPLSAALGPQSGDDAAFDFMIDGLAQWQLLLVRYPRDEAQLSESERVLLPLQA